MTTQNNTDALNPPEIDYPKNGDIPGHRFAVRGRGTPGNLAVAYSTSDPLNPLFGQAIGPTGLWSNSIDLREFGFYLVEKNPDNSETSPRSPVVTIKLA